MQPGYPKAISDGFPGIPRDLDAAILAAANNKMYFFKVNTSIAHVTTNLTFRVTTTGDLNLGRNLMWRASTPRLYLASNIFNIIPTNGEIIFKN